MCVSPGSGGHRARISADRCGGSGRGGAGWLHVNATIEGSILLVGAPIISRSVVSAGVEHGRHIPSATAEFIASCAADDGPVAV